MTTTRTTSGRRTLGWAIIAGTVPYLTLKVLWLTGSTVGVRDPAVLRDGSIVALNGVTVVADAMVIALALALTHAWGRRIPAWMLLLPAWVGSGFMLPMAVAILPATVLASGAADPVNPLEPWVQPMVYAGFAWQGVFLLAAFARYALDRWSSEIGTGAAPAASPLLAVVAGGGTVMAALSAGLHLLSGVLDGGMVVATTNAALAVLGAAGVLALVRGTPRPVLAAGAGWLGSAAMFSWGLWAAVNTMGSTALAATGAPVNGFAQLSGLLGGFALAVAGLLALLGPRTPRVGV